jgi:hypothetical protein
MDIKIVSIEKPEPINFILGQSHFIKTVEDIHETLVTSVPGIKFGLAFCPKERAGNWSGPFIHHIPCEWLLPNQYTECHQKCPRGGADILRHCQPHPGACGRDRTGPGHSWRDRRFFAKRRGRRGWEGLAQGLPAHDRLQTLACGKLIPGYVQNKIERIFSIIGG